MIAQNEVNMQEGLENKSDNRMISDKHRTRRILAQNK